MGKNNNSLHDAEIYPSGDVKQDEQKLPSYHYPENNPPKK